MMSSSLRVDPLMHWPLATGLKFFSESGKNIISLEIIEDMYSRFVMPL